jgi:hypothetical protein
LGFCLVPRRLFVKKQWCAYDEFTWSIVVGRDGRRGWWEECTWNARRLAVLGRFLATKISCFLSRHDSIQELPGDPQHASFPTAPSRVACLPKYFMYYNYLKRLSTRQVGVTFFRNKTLGVSWDFSNPRVTGKKSALRSNAPAYWLLTLETWKTADSFVRAVPTGFRLGGCIIYQWSKHQKIYSIVSPLNSCLIKVASYTF